MLLVFLLKSLKRCQRFRLKSYINFSLMLTWLMCNILANDIFICVDWRHETSLTNQHRLLYSIRSILSFGRHIDLSKSILIISISSVVHKATANQCVIDIITINLRVHVKSYENSLHQNFFCVDGGRELDSKWHFGVEIVIEFLTLRLRRFQKFPAGKSLVYNSKFSENLDIVNELHLKIATVLE